MLKLGDINSVSTSTRNYSTTNTTNDFSINKTTDSYTNHSEPSRNDTMKVDVEYLNHTIFENRKKQKNDVDMSDLIVHFETALQAQKLHNLDKEDKELLRWLDIDPGPSDYLDRLKRVRRQTSEPRRLKREAKSPGWHEKKLPSKSARVSSEKQLERIIPELRRNHFLYPRRYKASSSKGSLKRFRRKAEAAEKDILELWMPNSLNRRRPKESGSKRFRRQAEGLRWPGRPTPGPSGPLRQSPDVHNASFVKKKVINLMLQSLYSAQERLWPLGPLVAKYDQLTPYRMAFVFLKLDQIVYESHSLMKYIDRQLKVTDMSMTKRLQLYGQLMRRNIDVTYLVDYILERVPRDQVVRTRQWLIRYEQEKLMKDHILFAQTTTEVLGRPPK